jgi:hypothetical protein
MAGHRLAAAATCKPPAVQDLVEQYVMSRPPGSSGEATSSAEAHLLGLGDLEGERCRHAYGHKTLTETSLATGTMPSSGSLPGAAFRTIGAVVSAVSPFVFEGRPEGGE